jgi:predicted ATPase
MKGFEWQEASSRRLQVLDSLKIENFKIFRDLDLKLRPLTVLTGFNSGGKSTVLQALLLASLARKSENVALNGSYGLALGEGFDVLNPSAVVSEIRFTLMRQSLAEEIILTVPTDRAVTLAAHISRSTGLEPIDFRIGTYLSAERLGPRDLLEVPPAYEGVVDVGEQGQFTAHVLAQRERMKVSPELLHPEVGTTSVSITLSGQAEAWLSDIVRPVRVQATWLTSTSAAMIRFRDAPPIVEALSESSESEVPAEWKRPSNVGFGLSYALPIIVAGLSVQPGRILMIENPEAHLHPAGQSRMGYFLALVASSGVQTIIETHSEHLVNGIRLAIARDHRLSAESAIFHFFGDTKVSTMSISSTGAMSSWPTGFFDQAEEDLAELSRIKRTS